MKSVIEKGTKKYLAKFTGEPHWMFTTGIFQESFIKGETYKFFILKNGFQIICEGLLESESGRKKQGRRVFYSSKKDYLKRNFTYC